MLGINGGEFLLLIVVAVVVVGPERLPRYAEQLAVWVRTARRYALSAKDRVSEELGDDVGDVDWAALDPRRYDPRRIVREALLDDLPGPSRAGRPAGPRMPGAPGAPTGPVARGSTAMGAAAAAGGAGAADGAVSGSAAAGATSPVAPFDDEAT
ncbi:Sec-independent protein translocase TatB [uncultured Cellulomonas sp.]|uniref:Sec-independent protein translocase TatB n=1 Tax=uncultured Cellulomonas sp. TaxID=189682 RepID=UPI00260C6625|nr:Sec-independent protein translocase TatB [uncultured Cellulomonas sp.]